MARLDDRPEPGVLQRVLSPDRRLALDYLPYPDPRTAYELEAPESVALRDAETGARLASFGGWTFVERYEWPEAGGVVLHLPRGMRVVVAPDLQTFWTDEERAPVRPIDQLPAWLGGIVPPPQPIPRPSRLSQAVTILVFAALLALIGYGFSRLPPVRRLVAMIQGEAPSAAREGAISAWVVRCPGAGLVMMSVTEQGHLRVPPAIAPKPLPPLDETGRRFGDGRVAVEVQGMDATWWPRGPGGEALACPSTLGRES